MLGFGLRSVDGITVVPHEGIVLDKALGALNILLLGKYYGIEIK